VYYNARCQASPYCLNSPGSGWLWFPISVSRQNSCAVRGEAFDLPRLGAALIPGSLASTLDALGIAGLKPSFENAQQPNYHFKGAIHTYSHQHLWPYFERTQVMPDSVRLGSVPGRSTAHLQRSLQQRRSLHLSLKQLMDTQIFR